MAEGGVARGTLPEAMMFIGYGRGDPEAWVGTSEEAGWAGRGLLVVMCYSIAAGVCGLPAHTRRISIRSHFLVKPQVQLANSLAAPHRLPLYAQDGETLGRVQEDRARPAQA